MNPAVRPSGIEPPPRGEPPPGVEPPLGLLAELTHRCPLRCPYCSNPLELARASAELDTGSWCRVMDEAAALGVLQVHLSGGEPMARRDLGSIVAAAAKAGLYTNLITSGVMLDAAALAPLAEAGLDHVQLSFQDTDPAVGDAIAGLRGSHERKRRAAACIRAAGLPLTINLVVHRRNLTRIGQAVALAVDLGAARIEIAHAQYHGWGLLNRDALLPDAAAMRAACEAVAAARERHAGRIRIEHVLPDHFAGRPKACMQGWGRRFIVVTPNGTALPCHAAESLPGLAFPSVREQPLDAIWRESPAFSRFRGTAWMPSPCRDCDRREEDWGGCRCQAFALTGDAAATDPACALAPQHAALRRLVEAADGGALRYRGQPA